MHTRRLQVIRAQLQNIIATLGMDGFSHVLASGSPVCSPRSADVNKEDIRSWGLAGILHGRSPPLPSTAMLSIFLLHHLLLLH